MRCTLRTVNCVNENRWIERERERGGKNSMEEDYIIRFAWYWTKGARLSTGYTTPLT